ncbi:hypothetical protein WA158_002542 [Blastocystis sp. Blastoise]
MSSINLKYFNMKGRGDAIRLALELVNTQYNDERISFEKWGEIKTSGITDGSLPFGQLPQFTIDHFNLVQSTTILRFIAHKYNLEGSDEHSIYFGQMIMDSFEDLLNAYLNAAFSSNPKEQINNFYNTSFITFMNGLEKLFNTYNGKYWLGNQVSIVDCLSYSVLDQIIPTAPETNNYPHLLQSMKDFEQIEQIKTYLASNRR